MGDRWTILVDGRRVTVVDPESGAVLAVGASERSTEAAILLAFGAARDTGVTTLGAAAAGFDDSVEVVTGPPDRLASETAPWASEVAERLVEANFPEGLALRDAISEVAHAAAVCLDDDALDDVREVPSIEALRRSVRRWREAGDEAIRAITRGAIGDAARRARKTS